ncbi:hypothetical protein SCP_1401790 [Sparassis crispa]|uniref:HMG box domain-containing protein n=1 Tax=Sparassis crispa TaxID=139825 RepID=A0A401H2Z1_9APHY|nr:hypothetical protein SCP_1401790 [Sparassis crispa]GBE88774.1 hypothetical protein SCP_1401790 [Sparassis crispa]
MRVTRRRRSSLAIGLAPVKPGNYGISSPSPRNVTFAPNVTPGTYVEPEGDQIDELDAASATNTLFPPSETPSPSTSRRREPAGRRRSQGYIPRPANAFMLFRADFVRQKHVPGSIETSHNSLSKIIGNCWHALPLEDKKIWQTLAKKEKAEHRLRYPDYRFRPVHNKEKKAAKKQAKAPVSLSDERRCEEIAAFMLDGKKGDALVEAVRQYDMLRERTETLSPEPQLGLYQPSQIHAPQPMYPHRRSSSVPPPTALYNPITLPSVPFLVGASAFQMGGSRGVSPVNSISRTILGQRRASSAQPMQSRPWSMDMSFAGQGTPEAWQLQRDWEPLPAVNTSLFQPTYLNGNGHEAFGFGAPSGTPSLHEESNDIFNFNGFSNTLSQPVHDLSLSISPLENIPPHAPLSPFSEASSANAATPYSACSYSSDETLGPLDPSRWVPDSGSSTAFSGSPAQSDAPLPGMSNLSPEPAVFAPLAMHSPPFVSWEQQLQTALDAEQQQQHMMHEQNYALEPGCAGGMEMPLDMEHFEFEYEQGVYPPGCAGPDPAVGGEMFGFADPMQTLEGY